jgi:hypothetical protein
VMASLDANHLEPHPLECRDDVFARQPAAAAPSADGDLLDAHEIERLKPVPLNF